MSLLDKTLRIADRLAPARVARAHCDIPCGIYDPHAAQLAALTIIRMDQLMQNLQKQSADGEKAFAHEMMRLVRVKEEHADIVKKEVRIIWGDYFKPEHLQKYPDLHEKVWKIEKLASAARQKLDLKAAEDLLAAVQDFAVIFWATKGAQTKKQKSGQTVGYELVYPVW